MTTEITLYYNPFSFYSQKAKICLLEKNISFKEHIVELGKSDHLQPEYLSKINSKGQVPVIEQGGNFIPDSEAIYFYLENQYPEPSLIPANHRDEVLAYHSIIHEKVSALMLTFGALLSASESNQTEDMPEIMMNALKKITSGDLLKNLENFRDQAPTDLKPLYDAKIENIKKITIENLKEGFTRTLKIVHEVCDKMEEKLASLYHGDVIGCLFDENNLTIADIDLVVLLFRLKTLKLDSQFFSEENRPKLAKYFNLMMGRNSMKKTFQ